MTDTTGMLELAQWAYSRFLVPESLSIYWEILKLQSDHYDARLALGFYRNGDRWAREKQGEYRYREDYLRCGDKKGYEDLALWAGTNGVTEGVKECSYYLLRMDPFHKDALKWARPFLADTVFLLKRPPLDKSLHYLVTPETPSVFNLFSCRLAALDGKSLAGSKVICPVNGRIDYVQDLSDDTSADKPSPEADNFMVIASGSFRLRIGGFRKGAFAARTGEVKAGDILGEVGTPTGTALITMKAMDSDGFAIPIRYSLVSVTDRSGTQKVRQGHVVEDSDTISLPE
jgi:hypothetical protein